MTVEEAIKWLEAIVKKYIHSGDESFDNKRRQAIHIAIEVLKQSEQKKSMWASSAIEPICSNCPYKLEGSAAHYTKYSIIY